MRNPIENVSLLQKQLNDLQLENQLLKKLLDGAGISYVKELKQLQAPEETIEYESNQGTRIVHPAAITEDMAVFFYSRFWGRQDVYAKRYENKTTGKTGYYTQCNNFWKDNCPKKRQQKIQCKDCACQAYKKLKKEDVIAHLRGRSNNASDVIGVYPLLAEGTCRL